MTDVRNGAGYRGRSGGHDIGPLDPCVCHCRSDRDSAVVIHLDWRPATTGIAPALPERNLRQRAWWVDPTVVEQPAFTWVLGTDVSIGPVQVPRAVDLRQDGRIAVHVWAPRAVVTVTDTPREA